MYHELESTRPPSGGVTENLGFFFFFCMQNMIQIFP